MQSLKCRRNNSGFTQEKLAQKLELNRSTIAKWEAGKSFPRIELLPKLAKIFGCSIDDLLESRGISIPQMLSNNPDI